MSYNEAPEEYEWFEVPAPQGASDSNAVYGVCDACLHDTKREIAERARDAERIRHYRRALYLACGHDQAKVIACMRQAEEEMLTPNKELTRGTPR